MTKVLSDTRKANESTDMVRGDYEETPLQKFLQPLLDEDIYKELKDGEIYLDNLLQIQILRLLRGMSKKEITKETISNEHNETE